MCQTEPPAEDETTTLTPEAVETGLWPAIGSIEDASTQKFDHSGRIEESAGLAPNEIAGDPMAPVLEAIRDLGSQLEQRTAALQSVFEREVRAEETREKIVDRLHAELQDYKQDFLLKVQRPIFVDLIQLHDDLGKMVEAQPYDEGDGSSPLRGTLESIQTAIEDILYRQGVEPFRSEGQDFDPRRQRAVITVPAEEASLNRSIAGRIRPGFQAGEKLIRPELVSVYTLKK